MLFTDDRKRLRAMYSSSWQKHLAGKTLEPLEKQLVSLLQEHPEYHALISDVDKAADQDFGPDDGMENPFLHLGLHLGLREQVGTDRPAGIAAITRSLLLKYGDGHKVEHMMMECLAEFIWDAQRQQRAPDEQAYLERLKEL